MLCLKRVFTAYCAVPKWPKYQFMLVRRIECTFVSGRWKSHGIVMLLENQFKSFLQSSGKTAAGQTVHCTLFSLASSLIFKTACRRWGAQGEISSNHYDHLIIKARRERLKDSGCLKTTGGLTRVCKATFRGYWRILRRARGCVMVADAIVVSLFPCLIAVANDRKWNHPLKTNTLPTE